MIWSLWIDVRCNTVAEQMPVKKIKKFRVKNSPGITTMAFRVRMRSIVKALKLTRDRSQLPFDVRVVIRFKDIFPLSFNSLDLWRIGV